METITLKSGHKNIEVKISDITHLESMDNYVKIYRMNLPLVISQITMKEMEARLPKEKFMRVHRSYMVALDQILSYSNRIIHCRYNDICIPVGRKYLPEFTQYYRSTKS